MTSLIAEESALSTGENRNRMEWIIRTCQLGKTFFLEKTHATAYRLLRKRLFGESNHNQAIQALNDINIEVLRGERIGLVGNNGAGKTTLLKVIAGLYQPNDGQLFVRGEVTLLAGLGVGMLEELSVEENIFLYGSVYGLERRKIAENMDDILEWADLRDFIGARLKTLSSGMKTRLAFSVMRHIEKEIYLLDEVLTAGDRDFREKCAGVFENYKQSEKTFVVATHSLEFVESFCTKVLWLHRGQQMGFGETEMILEQYQEMKSR